MLRLRSKEIISILLYAIPNTFLNFGIIYLINNVLSGNKVFLKDYLFIVFTSIIVFTYLLNIVFQKALNKYAFRILYENEKKLFEDILNAPLMTLEKFGSNRFYTALEDIRIFSSLPYTLTHTVSSLLMIILGAGYMITLSPYAALIVLVFILVVGACYFVVMNSMSKEVKVLRKHSEDYFFYIDDLIKGFKELKMSAVRRVNVREKYMNPNRNKAEHLDFKINYVFLSINMISQYGLYFVIGIILFGLPAFGLLNQEEIIAYVVVILFISGPINSLINLQQMYTRFAVANQRINQFKSDFFIEESSVENGSDDNLDFQSLEFKDVTFSYESNNENETSFALGPISFKITKGEVVFVIGGNGSGKSTFIKTLTGLYKTTSGEVLINRVEGDIENDLQDSMVSVFTNNYLFSNNYEDYELENNEEYNELLKVMELDKMIDRENDSSSRRNFSKGQSKRMSLIFALLEKKPILILDEWAADQDPHFRKFFYEELIPKFKEEGKTVIAVTHDDAYFHHADRIVKLDYGKVIMDIKTDSDSKTALKNIW